MNKKNHLWIPKELAIETIFGCNLSCEMCYIDMPTSRKKRVMSMDLFHYIVDSMTPYKDHIDKVDLWGLSEPLLDPHIFERIRYLKDKGFRNLAISTNATLLNAEKRRLVLETGIETVIFSIDGVKKETHEKIRRGANFERVAENTQEIIRMRDREDFPTRFIVRFIRQEANKDEWVPFKAFWNVQLSQSKGDFVAMYDMHNYGGYIARKNDLVSSDRISESIEVKPCHFIFESLIILADGSLALCPPDFLEAKFGLGKVPDNSPMEAFNSKEYNKIRKIHLCGKKNDIQLCRECTVLYSEITRERGWDVLSGSGGRKDLEKKET